MDHRPFSLIGCGFFAGFFSITASAVPEQQSGQDTSLDAVLATIAEQCPAEYPEVEIRLPEPGGFANKSDAGLLDMLDSWNPALRASAVAELGGRGNAAIPALVEALSSDTTARRSGALEALGRMLRHQTANWQEFRPNAANRNAALQEIRSKFSGLLLDHALKLTRDSAVEVRGSALTALSDLQARGPEVSLAVLELGIDEDEYLADTTLRLLHREFGFSDLDQETLLPYIRQALKNPLPRGKGHLMWMILDADESLQRELVPDMLAHLDWQPDRDTMFGAGGQAEALQLLTKLRVKELVPRLPDLMDKTMRGPGLFDHCVASIKTFGPDARPILPVLKERLQNKESELAGLADRGDRQSRSRAEQLETRIKALKESLNHVES